MEWLWFDPDRGESTRWWTIDPRTGHPDGRDAADPACSHCLGESALDAVGMVADAIATEFATGGFSDGEVTALLSGRILPASFPGGPGDAADLLGSIGDLWDLAEGCYRRALGRLPGPVERRWLQDFAREALRARGGAKARRLRSSPGGTSRLSGNEPSVPGG